MTDWIRGWKANGWKASNGQPVVNREELEELDEISQKMKIRYVSANLQCTLPYMLVALCLLFMTRFCQCFESGTIITLFYPLTTLNLHNCTRSWSIYLDLIVLVDNFESNIFFQLCGSVWGMIKSI
jgi:hypothetical protein